MSETAASALGRLGADVEAVQAALPGIALDRIRVRPAPTWLLRSPYAGIALPWGIHLRPGLAERQALPTLLHELVHMEQWRRQGVVRFGVRYLVDYLSGLLRRRGHRHAYLEIRAEREARTRTVDLLRAAHGEDQA